MKLSCDNRTNCYLACICLSGYFGVIVILLLVFILNFIVGVIAFPSFLADLDMSDLEAGREVTLEEKLGTSSLK